MKRTVVALAALTLPAAAAVTFSQTALDVSATGTGAEIQHTGTVVEANHFGNGAQATITLDNGITFGGSTDSLIRPDGPNFQAQWEYNGSQTYQTGWSHNSTNDSGYSIANTAFNGLMNSRWWINYSASKSEMVISGLTVGNQYTLQLISTNPSGAMVSVEGSEEYIWNAGGPSVMSATWTATDNEMNLSFARYLVWDGNNPAEQTSWNQGGEPNITGYVLQVPEPAAVLLGGLGLLTLLRRRRNG
ncbi:MAG: PEP-CTERM sorting domain-containing protein [Akkermansiaceae bacterium]|nr:PEP-CTERM sorting domain-containing protein [Akkermansiaceae bacterium]